MLSRLAWPPQLNRRGRRPRGPVLFAVNGWVRAPAGVGADLFAAEPVFRETVERVAPIIKAVGGFDVLPAFREGVPARTNPDRALLLGVLQFGHVDLWRSHGVEPDATIGLCMGEIGAVYAAGGLTLDDAARVLAAFINAMREGCEPHEMFLIDASRSAAIALCEGSPVPLAFAGAFSSEEACVYSAVGDAAAAGRHIESRHRVIHRDRLDRATHTELAPSAAPTIRRHASDISPRPTTRPSFLASLGGELPAGTVLDVDHWGLSADSRFLYDKAADAALAMRPGTIVQIGASIYTSPHLACAARPDALAPRIVEAMRPGEPELVSWQRARDALGQRAAAG